MICGPSNPEACSTCELSQCLSQYVPLFQVTPPWMNLLMFAVYCVLIHAGPSQHHVITKRSRNLASIHWPAMSPSSKGGSERTMKGEFIAQIEKDTLFAVSVPKVQWQLLLSPSLSPTLPHPPAPNQSSCLSSFSHHLYPSPWSAKQELKRCQTKWESWEGIGQRGGVPMPIIWDFILYLCHALGTKGLHQGKNIFSNLSFTLFKKVWRPLSRRQKTTSVGEGGEKRKPLHTVGNLISTAITANSIEVPQKTEK